MSDREFKAGERNFKLLKVDAMSQFHIVRRIGPLLAEIMPAMAKVKSDGKDLAKLTEDEKFEKFAEILSPLFAGISKLTDADADYVLFRLLSAVEVEQPEHGSWTRVASHQGIKMQDIELQVLMQAAGRALMYNLSGFLALRPQKSGAKN